MIVVSVSENNRRIARNTLLLYGRKAVTMLIALYSSRVLLQYLGIAILNADGFDSDILDGADYYPYYYIDHSIKR